MPPAARLNDKTGHGQSLSPGIGSHNVLIRFQPAWRAVPAGVAAAVESASQAIKEFMQSPSLNPTKARSDLRKIKKGLIKAAEKSAAEGNLPATAAASGATAGLDVANNTLTTAWETASKSPSGQPAADRAYTKGIKDAMALAAGAVFTSIGGVTDIHACPVPSPLPPHGPGVVTQASKTVLINNLPATRLGDRVFEACGGDDPIAAGEPSVIIGDHVGSGTSGEGGGRNKATTESASAEPLLDELLRQNVVQALTGPKKVTVSEVSPEQLGPLEPEEDDPADPTWIGVRLMDFDGTPVPNEDLVITLDDGQMLTGKTDEAGRVRFDGVQPASGEVAFWNIPDQQEVRPQRRQPESKQKDEPSATAACGPTGDVAGQGPEPAESEEKLDEQDHRFLREYADDATDRELFGPPRLAGADQAVRYGP